MSVHCTNALKKPPYLLPAVRREIRNPYLALLEFAIAAADHHATLLEILYEGSGAPRNFRNDDGIGAPPLIFHQKPGKKDGNNIKKGKRRNPLRWLQGNNAI